MVTVLGTHKSGSQIPPPSASGLPSFQFFLLPKSEPWGSSHPSRTPQVPRPSLVPTGTQKSELPPPNWPGVWSQPPTPRNLGVPIPSTHQFWTARQPGGRSAGWGCHERSQVRTSREVSAFISPSGVKLEDSSCHRLLQALSRQRSVRSSRKTCKYLQAGNFTERWRYLQRFYGPRQPDVLTSEGRRGFET